jgi:hypothetical protein
VRVSQVIARLGLFLSGAGLVTLLSLVQAHVSYPWHEHGHEHWLPVIWILAVYLGCFVAACALVIGALVGLNWCWRNR